MSPLALRETPPICAAAENGLIKLVRGRHTQAFLDELTSFPHGKHDDCIDALSGAHNTIDTRTYNARIYIPQGYIDYIPQGYIDTPTPGGNLYNHFTHPGYGCR